MSDEGCTEPEKVYKDEESNECLIETRFKENIVGQESAITQVADAIKRKESGWFNEDHPLVFLFLGTSGIGKTELAKQVANYVHEDDKQGFIRVDMSEYHESYQVARFLGVPRGYKESEQGGLLTEALKKCNNAVVLFDEVEKAHPKVLVVMLQLFDEGRLTDGNGHTVECKEAIFIMTSNLASDAIMDHVTQLRAEQQTRNEIRLERDLRSLDGPKFDNEEPLELSSQFKDTVVQSILKRHFRRDEFLGRINQVVIFLPFSKAEIKQLVKKELDCWKAKARKRFNIELTWDDKVLDVIPTKYNAHYGARSIRQEIEQRLINQLSKKHKRNKNAKKVHVSVGNARDKNGYSLFNIKFSK